MAMSSGTGTSSAPIVYQEEQRFSQWWVWILVLVPAAIAWWSFVQQIVLGRPFGDNPAPDWVAWVLWVVIGLGLPLLFARLKLVVEVTSQDVVIRYSPLTRRAIPLADIEQLEVRKYNPMLEYGGWGVKGWTRGKMAYNVKGNEGVDLMLRGGRRLMLGSQKAEELADAIEAQLIAFHDDQS